MAMLLPVEMLARVTSLLLLAVFALVNLSLLRIRRRAGPDYDGFSVPAWVPLGGSLSAAVFLFYQLIAGALQ